MPGQFLATVEKNESLGPAICRLTILAPEIAAAGQPGQFVMLRSGRGLDPLLSRPFSLHQTFPHGRIQVLFKVLGEGTRKLAALGAGEPLGIVGPLGRGFDLAAPRAGARLGLIGGGMGVAPLFFLAREIQRRLPEFGLDVLLGARAKQELEQLLIDFGPLKIEPRVATDDGSLGHHGLVPELIEKEWGKDGKLRQVFCCGPWPMMAAVAQRCRERDWSCQVSLETMMACGFSACLGCAVAGSGQRERYFHVCKDGPVFNAADISWE
ncbi:dihydroorotate dehydrogenase electron transfer subunit [Desulfurivibrio alkaliphilus]|uniref:Dihydroorotate dehydrogenase B (NAD(+)), electron transfer subunit n=1 Tax=Desulfurivibrio alkaliphilus (strain DSM 19089 / UNIQEM U267 / AHT2) TaxID=589865 RepID=D6Z559_DESAT|nr:dihydroorotate dehydrogenase electron transfer subunit [Desulfurivibrio alkaliphilus]ADH86684.1 Dihydroorotate dehydrogenase, electron transfer subunit, iron-sulfur cluster binding domain protein [Desulfurivibrio alkaliphilus AHT 2]